MIIRETLFDWKKGIILPVYKGKRKIVIAIVALHYCQRLVRCLQWSYWIEFMISFSFNAH